MRFHDLPDIVVSLIVTDIVKTVWDLELWWFINVGAIWRLTIPLCTILHISSLLYTVISRIPCIKRPPLVSLYKLKSKLWRTNYDSIAPSYLSVPSSSLRRSRISSLYNSINDTLTIVSTLVSLCNSSKIWNAALGITPASSSWKQSSTSFLKECSRKKVAQIQI